MAEQKAPRGGRRVDATGTLLYGHLGTATYNEQLRQWVYLRQIPARQNGNCADDNEQLSSTIPPFEPLQAPVTYLEDSLKIWNIKGLGDEDVRTFDYLVSHQPDAIIASVPVEEQITRHRQYISASENESTNVCSLVIGTALLLTEGKSIKVTRTCPIIALTIGYHNENIQIFSLKKRTQLLHDRNGEPKEYGIPTTSHQISTFWKSSSEEIVKMCFTRQITNFSEKPLLAVLKPSCTTLFQPQIHDTTVGQMYDLYQAIFAPGARIEANPVISLPASRTGGHFQADIAFNPEEITKFAIIDVHGNWSIWSVEVLSRQKNNTWNLHLHNSGKFVTRRKKTKSKAPNLYYDGWHRICWVRGSSGQFDSLFVCNRRLGAVFDAEDEVVKLVDMRLSTLRLDNWIIDLRQGIVQQHLYYVLTSTHIMVLRSSLSDVEYHPESRSMTHICSWNHFRNELDYDMRISLLELADVTYIFLYSKANVLVTVFSFGFDNVSPADIVSKADPVLFEFPKSITEHYAFQDLIIQPAQEERKSSERATALGKSHFLLFARMKTGAVIELLYRSALTSDSPDTETGNISYLRWPKYAFSRTEDFHRDKSDDGSFMVEDEVWDYEEDLKKGSKKPSVKAMIKPPPRLSLQEQTNSNFTSATKEITEPILASSLSQAMRDANLTFQNLRPGWHQQLLGDFMKFPSILDVQTDSKLIQSWLQSRKDFNQRFIQIIEVKNSSVLETYTELVQSYVQSVRLNLPQDVSGKLERICGQVALDVYMANLAVQPKFLERSQGLDLSYNPAPGSYSVNASQMSLLPSSQLLSSQSSLPALEPTSRPTSETSNEAISRLSLYTSFNKKIAESQPNLDAVFQPETEASQIFAHFPPTPQDPSAYSHRRTLERVSAFLADLQAQALDPKARRRLERNAGRQKRQQERQDQLSQAVSQQLSSVPEIMSSSQIIPERQIQSSQIVPSVGMSQDPIRRQTQIATSNERNFENIMTQPERGEFGTRNRDMRKPKKKKRKEGF